MLMFFFKQKTAYEMRISDWSSDVCSSDLTRVLSDWIIVRVTANPGEAFLDRMIAMVEGAKRGKTPNEVALTILLVALTIIFLLVCVTLLPFSDRKSVVSGTSVSVRVDLGGRRSIKNT